MTNILRFQEHLASEAKSPRTIKEYGMELAHFAEWIGTTYGEDLSPTHTNRLDVLGYKAYLLTKGLKASSINKSLAAIKAFGNWAVDKGLIQDSCAGKVKGIAQQPQAPKALSTVEVNRLLREVHRKGKRRDIALLTTMVSTGLRVSEIAALTIADIDLSERSGTLIVRLGKGSKQRTVPLNKEVRTALREHLAEQPQGPALFSSQKGGAMSISAIWRLVTGYGEKAGVELTPHQLRHSFATDLLRKHRADIVEVGQLLGHSSPATTARYTKASDGDLQALVEKASRWQP